jgi:hypothetical protein
MILSPGVYVGAEALFSEVDWILYKGPRFPSKLLTGERYRDLWSAYLIDMLTANPNAFIEELDILELVVMRRCHCLEGTF